MISTNLSFSHLIVVSMCSTMLKRLALSFHLQSHLNSATSPAVVQHCSLILSVFSRKQRETRIYGRSLNLRLCHVPYGLHSPVIEIKCFARHWGLLSVPHQRMLWSKVRKWNKLCNDHANRISSSQENVPEILAPHAV